MGVGAAEVAQMQAHAPCLDCDRPWKCIGCHSTCEDYLRFVEENKAMREMIQKKKQEEWGKVHYRTRRQFMNACRNMGDARVTKQIGRAHV